MVAAKHLFEELRFSEKNKLSEEKVKLIVDLLANNFSSVINYDEVWMGQIYEPQSTTDSKNVITSLNGYETTGLCLLRQKYTTFFLDLCSHSLQYDKLKELYKRKLYSFKNLEPSFGQRDFCMLTELHITFDQSKTAYFHVLCEAVASQLAKYKQLRKSVLTCMEKPGDDKWRQ